LDPTPLDPSEYTTFTTTRFDYGGGSIIDGAIWSGATGDAQGRIDLFRVALHEVGHALGLSINNDAFRAEACSLGANPGLVVVDPGLPYAGTALPVQSASSSSCGHGAHLFTCGTLVQSAPAGCSAGSQRRLPSEADILTMLEISKFQGMNFMTSGPHIQQLSTPFAGGSVGGAIYFGLEARTGSGGVSVRDLDLNCGLTNSIPGVPLSINVYVQQVGAGPGSYDPAGTWSLHSTASGWWAGQGNPTRFTLNKALELSEGCVAGVAVEANGFYHRYTTGSSNPTVFSNADVLLVAGSATNTPFTAPVVEPSLPNINVHYALGGSCSEVETYGFGCVEGFNTIYELMEQVQAGTSTMDLGGREIYGAAIPGGLQIRERPATIHQIGALGAASQLALGDDDQVAAGSLGLVVGSNGWVARGPGNSNGYHPLVTTMRSNPSEAYYAWTDLNPSAAGSGKVWYEEAGTQWTVTFDGVFTWSTNNPVTIQFRGDVATDAFVIAFGSLVGQSPQDWLVGHSGAGLSLEPCESDLSALGPNGAFVTDVDQSSLSLEAVNQPVLGGPFVLRTKNIPSDAVFHVGVLGLGTQQLPLQTLFPAMVASCTLYADLDLLIGPQVVWGGPGQLTWTGVDLTTATLLGVDLYFQSLSLGPGGIGATTRASNGLRARTNSL
jgi:hypothetical protein